MSMFQPMATAFPRDTITVARAAQDEVEAAFRNPAGRLTASAVSALIDARKLAAKAELGARCLHGSTPCPDWQVVRYSAQASLDAVRAIVAACDEVA